MSPHPNCHTDNECSDPIKKYHDWQRVLVQMSDWQKVLIQMSDSHGCSESNWLNFQTDRRVLIQMSDWPFIKSQTDTDIYDSRISSEYNIHAIQIHTHTIYIVSYITDSLYSVPLSITQSHDIGWYYYSILSSLPEYNINEPVELRSHETVGRQPSTASYDIYVILYFILLYTVYTW